MSKGEHVRWQPELLSTEALQAAIRELRAGYRLPVDRAAEYLMKLAEDELIDRGVDDEEGTKKWRASTK